MATAKFDIKSEATKTLYAGAGVVDLGVEAVREAVADAQKRFADVQKNVTSYDLKTASKQAKARRDAVEKRVVELQDEARTLPKKVSGLVKDNVDTATDTYEDLAKRGQTLVRRIRRQESTKATAASAKQTVRSAKTTTTQGTKAAKSTTATAKRAVKSTTKAAVKKSASARSSAKGTATSAKKTASSASKATSAAASKVGN
jgi:hypothetical protein